MLSEIHHTTSFPGLVRMLSLQEGKIPAELGGLTSVERLNLYSNGLTGEG